MRVFIDKKFFPAIALCKVDRKTVLFKGDVYNISDMANIINTLPAAIFHLVVLEGVLENPENYTDSNNVLVLSKTNMKFDGLWLGETKNSIGITREHFYIRFRPRREAE